MLLAVRLRKCVSSLLATLDSKIHEVVRVVSIGNPLTSYTKLNGSEIPDPREEDGVSLLSLEAGTVGIIYQRWTECVSEPQ